MKSRNAFLLKPYLYLLIILFGIGLKFYNLEDKFFCDDEIATVINTSGIGINEHLLMLPKNKVVNKEFYTGLLEINDRGLNIFEQFYGLGMIPQYAPMHNFFLVVWSRIFGDSQLSFRYFSLVIFLLCLPFLFLLAKKVFKSSLTAWITVALFSVSPFFQFHAQHANYYILWAFSIILLHYIFLVVVEKQNLKWWLLYIGAATLAIHASILSYVLIVSHFIYYTIFYRDKIRYFLISLFVLFLLCAPWLFFLYLQRDILSESFVWQSHEVFGEQNYLNFIWSQILGVGQVFNNLNHRTDVLYLQVFYELLPLLFLLLSTVFIFFSRRKREKYFILLISFLGIISFLVIDYFRGTFTSYHNSYGLFYYIGFVLLFSFGLKEVYRRSAVLFVLCFLIFTGGAFLSSKFESDDLCSRKRADCHDHLNDIDKYFSGDEKVLIISDYELIMPKSYTTFISMLLRAENDNIDVLYLGREYPNIRKLISSKSYEHVYAMYLSEDLRTFILGNFTDDEISVVESRKLYDYFYLPVYRVELK